MWYDPDHVYADVAVELELPDATVVRSDGSFVKLRQQIDCLLNGEQPPRLVVYVPEAHDRINHALAELKDMGVVMRPAQHPASRNTNLSLVARHGLKPIVGEETAAEVEKQAEADRCLT